MIIIKIWGLHPRLSKLEDMVGRWLDKKKIEYEAEDEKEYAGDTKYWDAYFKIDSKDEVVLKGLEKHFARSDVSIWMEDEYKERMG